MDDFNIDEEFQTDLQHQASSLKLSIASKQMNKLMFNAAERQVISVMKQPTLLRKRLIYNNLK